MRRTRVWDWYSPSPAIRSQRSQTLRWVHTQTCSADASEWELQGVERVVSTPLSSSHQPTHQQRSALNVHYRRRIRCNASRRKHTANIRRPHHGRVRTQTRFHDSFPLSLHFSADSFYNTACCHLQSAIRYRRPGIALPHHKTTPKIAQRRFASDIFHMESAPLKLSSASSSPTGARFTTPRANPYQTTKGVSSRSTLEVKQGQISSQSLAVATRF